MVKSLTLTVLCLFVLTACGGIARVPTRACVIEEYGWEKTGPIVMAECKDGELIKLTYVRQEVSYPEGKVIYYYRMEGYRNIVPFIPRPVESYPFPELPHEEQFPTPEYLQEI